MSVENIFLTLHLVTWVLLICNMIELHTLKKEVRQIVDYENTLKRKRRELKNGD